jgi:hypothetical protein
MGFWSGGNHRGRTACVLLSFCAAAALFPGAAAAAPACAPATSIAAIIDDSGSMIGNDPREIRRSALELLITKPSNQGKEMGAVEFGEDADLLFAPAPIAAGQAGMLSALGGIASDGTGGRGGATDYNAAFLASATSQPQANARIFLTDGGHNEGRYENLHLGGPPTYVIGLNIGPAGRGNSEADLVGRIADQTGGRYFPLARKPRDGTAAQVARLQPTINRIDGLLSCQKIQAQRSQQFHKPGQRGAPIVARFRENDALEIVVTWPVAGADLDVVNCVARDKKGRIVADLHGKRRIKGTKRRRAKIGISQVEGATYETVTVQRPKGARTVEVRIAAVALPGPVKASVQVRSVPPAPPAASGTVSPAPPAQPPGPPAPPPPLRRVLTVDNRVTNGMGMREDSVPVRLTTQPWTHCTSRGCNIYGTERGTGGTYDAAVCQTTGERTTNGHDSDPSDDANPERFESTRYYGVRLTDGTFGYVSEVWIRAADRGGLGLPQC